MASMDRPSGGDPKAWLLNKRQIKVTQTHTRLQDCTNQFLWVHNNRQPPSRLMISGKAKQRTNTSKKPVAFSYQSKGHAPWPIALVLGSSVSVPFSFHLLQFELWWHFEGMLHFGGIARSTLTSLESTHQRRDGTWQRLVYSQQNIQNRSQVQQSFKYSQTRKHVQNFNNSWPINKWNIIPTIR